MLKSLGLVLTVSVTAFAAKPPVQFDPPDLNFEFQLHRQYMLARGEQPQNQTPKGLIESYRLQRGENLWNLSQMLYGDGNYWPKVWAQNKVITNPHLIRPGHTLHFQMGSEDDTPSFRFSEAEEPGGIELAAATGGGSQIEIPPPEVPPRPLIKVPSSFPEWQSVYGKRGQFQVDWSKMNTARPMPPDRLPLSAYVQDTPLDDVGSFLELERESGLPVTNQYAYVKIKKGVGQIGQKYSIVKDMGRIRKLNEQVEGKIEAHYIQVFGDLQLTDTAPASFRKSRDRENYEVFRALMGHVTSLSLTDYRLVPGAVEVVDLSRNGREGTANAQIIGSNKHDSSALYGAGDIVFLNKGSQDGVEAGQIYDIYIDRTIRDERTPVSFSTVSSGQVKVVKSAIGVSTGVILKAIDSIQQGDRAQPRVSTNVAEPEIVNPVAPSLKMTIENDGSESPVPRRRRTRP